jgi:hypothetical protein
MANGKPKGKRLSKEDFLQKKFKRTKGEVELPAMGGSVEVQRLTVGQRRKLPPMVDENGERSLKSMASSFAAVVVDPVFTVEEAEGFLDDMEATDLDEIYVKLAELTGTEEDRAALEREFRPSED